MNILCVFVCHCAFTRYRTSSEAALLVAVPFDESTTLPTPLTPEEAAAAAAIAAAARILFAFALFIVAKWLLVDEADVVVVAEVCIDCGVATGADGADGGGGVNPNDPNWSGAINMAAAAAAAAGVVV